MFILSSDLDSNPEASFVDQKRESDIFKVDSEIDSPEQNYFS